MAKTYPFSVQKHGHDIEFYRNRLYNIMCDMVNGEIPMDYEKWEKMYDFYHGELEELYETILWCSNGYTVQLTGKQIGLAKKIVFWASEQRANSCIERGRYDLLQYC